ncbi:MAG: beta-Ala-His dipeptidase, partial [Clostridia bacterium]|nr:beta-Ala-His dipeptidase [Clostridia bacterium]
MSQLSGIAPKRVFQYFEEICSIPRGSENMKGMADYCVKFAEKNSLKAVRDNANNVIIYKPAAQGYEKSEPIILQGHLDMVCQKEDKVDIDFLKEGITPFVDGDFIRAKGTTLGADNGIAVALIMAILEDKELKHPPIEAVFTTDEEIGMIGARQLDMSLLSGRKMINLDAEEDETLTVSCAGGSDVRIIVPVTRNMCKGTAVTVALKGLRGGHSGVEIDKGRVNSDILAGRFLNHIKSVAEYEVISVCGGDKANAIPNNTVIELCVEDALAFKKAAEEYLAVIKQEISSREPDFSPTVTVGAEGEYGVLEKSLKEKLIYLLAVTPNGVMKMSAEIEGLVETSLNLGILKTEEEKIVIHFALRSNKKSSLDYIEEKMVTVAECIPGRVETFGHYPPWEYKENSQLQRLFKETFSEIRGFEPKAEAIHAGLECGVFSAALLGLDCIA